MPRPEHPQLTPGQSVVDHELLEVLGRGASATVFRARSPSGKEVALKVRPSGDPGLDRRFLREFESIRRLRLDSVVRVLDAGLTSDWIWYSMEVVEGVPLRQYIAQGSSVPERTLRACEAGARLSDALAGLHQASFVHRDLKPSNVLVTRKGQVRILDFGVVQWWAVSETLTGSGGLIGTPSFMSPEAIGGVPITGASDVFAVGLMIYEGMVGRRPRPPQPTGWLARQVLNRTPPMVCVDPKVSRELSWVVERCLSFAPEHRPAATELASLLRGCLDGTTPADWPQAYQFVGRRVELQALDSHTQGTGGRTAVLLGPAGSGRHRLQEQVSRRAMLRGTRTLIGQCQPESPGHPVGQWLRTLLSAPDKLAWREKVVASDSGPLLQIWPNLPLHMLSDRPAGEATQRDVIQAAVDSLERAARHQALILVLDRAEAIDPLSSRVLKSVDRLGDPRISVLTLMDSRRMTPRAERLVDRVRERRGAQVLRLAPLLASQAQELAQSLLPGGSEPPQLDRSTPLQATRAGLVRLAALRSEPLYPLSEEAHKLAIMRQPLPLDVALGWLDNAAKLLARGELLQTIDNKLRHAGPSFLTLADAGLDDPQQAHRELAEAWAREGQHRSRWIPAATHRLAGASPQAWEACVRAADAAHRCGRYTQARDFLMVLDTLKQDRRSGTYRRFRFDLAFARARVASRTDAERPRQDLVNGARSRAINAEELHLATLLQAELELRHGRADEALTLAYDTARSAQDGAPAAAAALWMLCAEAWMEQARFDRAADCAKAGKEQARRADEDLLLCEATAAEIGARLAAGELKGMAAHSLAGIRWAEELGHDGALAWHRRNLGVAWMRVGERRRAEDTLAQARVLYVRNSDIAGAATTSLQLAALAVGRGEPAVATRWLRDGLATARKLRLARLEPLAATIQLDLAAQTGDPVLAREARTAADAYRESWNWKLSELRWLRLQGMRDEAEALVRTVPVRGYSGALAQLELARLRLEEEEPEHALNPLKVGLELAREARLKELVTYGELLEGVLHPHSVHDWEARCQRARASTWVELFLGSLELDARYLRQHGQEEEALKRLRTLHSRAVDMGNRPYARVALELLRM